jgi:hypothetical protein
MKRIFFFATPNDIVPVLRRFQNNAPLKYVETIKLATPNRSIYLDPGEIPNPGISTQASGNTSIEYMVSLRDKKNQVYTFVDSSGTRRWMINGADNEDAVILNMAGLWRTGTLLPGIMDTMHDTRVAQQLMRWFLASLKQEGFVKMDLWWLGREAMTYLRGGRRLTIAEQAPPEYDLQPPV